MEEVRRLAAAALLLLACAAAAAEEDSPSAAEAPRLGLIFNLIDPFHLAAASDGVQSGLGMKVRLNDRDAIRGLPSFWWNGATSVLDVGADLACERHLAVGRIQAHVGGFAGIEASIGAASGLAAYGGGLLGAEVRLLASVALFSEYNLIVMVQSGEITGGLRIGNNALLGSIVCLP